MSIVVAKFGGSSLASAEQFKKVRDIVLTDKRRVYVVPSAPGKRSGADEKVTDMLYGLHAKVSRGENFDDLLEAIKARYDSIIAGIGVDYDIGPEFETIKKDLLAGASADYAASRGEYLCAIVLSKYLGYDFIDAAEVFRFDSEGCFDAEKTNSVMAERLKKHARAVIPGFYGAKPDGSIKTFSRGGSDISGAVVARAASAILYENWTDVSGFMMADPKIVDNPKSIPILTYGELRELSYMGATVLHTESIFPVRQADIPVNVRNTNAPDHPGTMIVNRLPESVKPGTITGIAGKKGFTVISIEKDMMNVIRGFGRRVLSILERHGINFEHMPSGIDTLSVVIDGKEFNGKLSKVLEDMRTELAPDVLDVHENMSLIATVGHGMRQQIGIAAKIFTKLAENGVNIRMIDQGSSELNIIIGVEDEDFEKAVRAIYEAFVPKPSGE